MKTLAFFLRLLKPYSGKVALSVLTGTATLASGIGLLGTSAYLVSSAALHPSVAALQVAIVGVRFFGISRGIFRYLERLISHQVNLSLLAELRVWFYRQLEPRAPAILQKNRAGDLLQRSLGDIETMESLYLRGVAPLLEALIITIGISLFVGKFHPLPGLILAGGLVAAGTVVPFFTRALARGLNRQSVEVQGQMTATLVDSIQGVADLLAAGAENRQMERFQALENRQSRIRIGLAVVNGLSSGLHLMASNLTLWVMLLVSIPLVTGGFLEATLLAVLSMIVMASFESTLPLVSAAQTLDACTVSGERLLSVSKETPAVMVPLVPLQMPRQPAVSLRQLNFRYEPGLPRALVDLDLELPVGKWMAVTGPSGAGKTTLVSVLLRFWDCPPATYFVGGVDARSLPLEDVRGNFGVASQPGYLFNGSIRQNLSLADATLKEGRMLDALNLVGLDGWLNLQPQGLDTWIGETGVRLSAGERQRLVLARTLLRDSPILILDEPTANLDAHTENALVLAIQKAARGRSLLWVTHRLVGLDVMDEIIVLDQGRVVERGRQVNLVSGGGLFARLWQLQNWNFKEDAGTNSAFGAS